MDTQTVIYEKSILVGVLEQKKPNVIITWIDSGTLKYEDGLEWEDLKYQLIENGCIIKKI